MGQPLKKDGGRPRILVLTRNFPPLCGGMERLIYHAYLELTKEFDVFVCGPEGIDAFLPREAVAGLFPVSPAPLFLCKSSVVAYISAKRLRPDLILCGSGVMALAARFAPLRGGGVRVAFLHGLDLVAQSKIYQLFFVPQIRKLNRVIVNSYNTLKLAKDCGIGGEKISLLFPGVELPDVHCNSALSLRNELGFGQRPIILSAGRLTARKGVLQFIRIALPLLVKKFPDILLLIIGGDADNAIMRSQGSTQKIKEQVDALGLQHNVCMLGSVDDDTLKRAYLESDVHVFPVLDLPGDVEGFGMVAVEAAAHGLPTVAFAVGGVPDAIENGKSGFLVAPASYEELSDRLSHIILMSDGERSDMKESCRQFARKFEWSTFGRSLRDICWSCLD